MTEGEKDNKQISLDKARELLGDDTIGDEALAELMNNLKRFCSIICAVYKQEKNKETKQEMTKRKPKGIKSAA